MKRASLGITYERLAELLLGESELRGGSLPASIQVVGVDNDYAAGQVRVHLLAEELEDKPERHVVSGPTFVAVGDDDDQHVYPPVKSEPPSEAVLAEWLRRSIIASSERSSD